MLSRSVTGERIARMKIECGSDWRLSPDLRFPFSWSLDTSTDDIISSTTFFYLHSILSEP